MEEIRQSSYLERWLKYKEQIVEGLAKAPGALIALLIGVSNLTNALRFAATVLPYYLQKVRETLPLMPVAKANMQ